MSQEKPADGPENPEKGGEMGAQVGASPCGSSRTTATALDQALERLPEGDAAAAFLRRAQLAEDRLAEVLAAYRTLKRENEGHRERVARNLERRYEGRRERLVMRFIEVLDNLDRALEAAETAFASEALVHGMILVRTQLLHLLSEEGLERIPVLGLPYDPQFSEAVETLAVDQPDQHHLVVKELLRGYRLNGRVARASRVVVAEYVEGGAAASASGPASSAQPHPVLGVDLRASTYRWQPPTPEPFTPPAGVATAVASERDEDELTLDEIIARAESLDHEPGESGGAEKNEAAKLEADDLPSDVGDNLLGYGGDDEAADEDERG